MTAASQQDLHDFFSSYFNQDWKDGYAMTDEVIAQYVNDVREPDKRSRLADHIEALVTETPDDLALMKALKDLGSHAVPEGEGAARAWLRDVAAKLRAG